MGRTIPNWASLAEDILAIIAKRLLLHSLDDILRFRSVCHSFRSSSSVVFPPKTLNVPQPPFSINSFSGSSSIPGDDRNLLLTQTTVYAMEPLEKISDTHDTTQTWLVQVFQDSNSAGKVQIVHPLCGPRYENSSKIVLPKSLNLLDYRMKEITKAYRLELATIHKGEVMGRVHRDEMHMHGMVPTQLPKIAVSPSCLDGFAIMVIHNETKKLGVWRNEDSKWTNIDTAAENFEDLVYYNKKFYAVCNSVLTVAVDSKSLSVIEVAGHAPQNRHYRTHHLVKSFMNLFLVVNYKRKLDVFKLDEERDKWVPVIDELEDIALFVGDNCSFSLSAEEFVDCRGNCVYYIYGLVGFKRRYPGSRHRIYELSDGAWKKLRRRASRSHSKILWPPPTWLKQQGS